MCKTKSATIAAQPTPKSGRSAASAASAFASTSSGLRNTSAAATATGGHSSSRPGRPNSALASSSTTSNSAASSSSAGSLASLRYSLPRPPALYPFSELSAATNNFLAKRLASSSSSAWRCTLRGEDAVVFQRPFRGRDPAAVPSRLAALSKPHHASIVRLLGTSLPGGGDHIYLVYEYCAGASLAHCLRNPQNPSFTPLSSWSSRVRAASDVVDGLQYIHNHSSVAGGVHNRVKSSAIIVTEPDFRTKICHFGAAELAGEIPSDVVEDGDAPAASMRRSGSGRGRIEGTREYMAPELLAGGPISQRSDVYALGVLLLELLSGEEPLKFRYDAGRGVYERVSLIDTATAAVGAEDEDSATAAKEERLLRVRRWMDGRLRDSFPVEAAEKLIRVALRCVREDAAARPDITWVAGKVSRIYLDSKAWEETFKIPTEISVSIAPR